MWDVCTASQCHSRFGTLGSPGEEQGDAQLCQELRGSQGSSADLGCSVRRDRAVPPPQMCAAKEFPWLEKGKRTHISWSDANCNNSLVSDVMSRLLFPKTGGYWDGFSTLVVR